MNNATTRDTEYIALAIEILLIDTGITRFRLADLSGVAHRTLYGIMVERRDCRASTINQIAAAFNLRPSELLAIGEAYHDLGIFCARSLIPSHVSAQRCSSAASQRLSGGC